MSRTKFMGIFLIILGVISVVIGGGESKTETGPSDATLAGQKNKKKKK